YSNADCDHSGGNRTQTDHAHSKSSPCSKGLQAACTVCQTLSTKIWSTMGDSEGASIVGEIGAQHNSMAGPGARPPPAPDGGSASHLIFLAGSRRQAGPEGHSTVDQKAGSNGRQRIDQSNVRSTVPREQPIDTLASARTRD